MGRIIVVGDRNQSCYGFRGADVNAIPSLLEMLEHRKNGCRTFPLSVCRRSPVSHIRLAQSLVPDIQWMTKQNSGTDAPEGEIYQVSENVALDRMIEGDMGIGRVNKVLIPAAYQLIRMRKKVIIRGRDIGTGLIALIKKMRAKSITELLSKLGAWFEKEVSKLCAKENVDKPALLMKGATKFQSLEDRVGCIEALCDGIETLDELFSTIEKLFGDFDDDGQPKQAIVLGTVHRTKGLEAHNITILDPEHFPHPLGRKSWERVQEKNLAYVAVTRSKFKLNAHGDVVEPGRLTFVGQCPSIFKAYWLSGKVQYPEIVTSPVQAPKDISVLQRSISQVNKERDDLEKQAVAIFQKQFGATKDAALKSVIVMAVADLQQVVNACKNSDGSNKRMSSEEKRLLEEKWRQEAEIRAIEEAMF